MLELDLLGVPRVRHDGRELRLTVRKTLVLLALVAVSVSVTRPRLCALLWPDLDESSARRNLRRTLARLREAGVASGIVAADDRVTMDDNVRIDVRRFEQALAGDDPLAALALWRGPFAEGLEASDDTEADTWLADTRRRLRQAWRDASARMAARCEQAGDLRAALRHVTSLLADDPLHEHQHRQAMRLLGALGEREAALAHYERCSSLLAGELGLEPMAETRELLLAIRGDTALTKPDASSAVSPATPAANLLPDTLPFVGRTAEAALLEVAWECQRLIVVSAPAGVGKTRLATDFAAAHGAYATLSCRSGDASVAYGSFTRALRSLLAAGEAPQASWVRTEIARLLPEIGEAPPPLADETQRLRFFEACACAWVEMTADNFGSVVVDDLHLADAASGELFAFVAQRLHELTQERSAVPRMIVTLRVEELAEPLARRLDSAVRDGLADSVRLQPLVEAEVFDLVRRLSKASSPQRFAARLHGATAGNAFFMHETLRHLVATGWLTRGANGEWSTTVDESTADYGELPLPRSVHEAALERIRRSGDAVARALEAASLAEEPFDTRTLAGSTALGELELADALDRAATAQIVIPAGQGFRFAHDLLRQACAGSLSAARAALIHARLAIAGESRRADAARIALHWQAGGEPLRAVPWLLRAGALASERLATVDAIGLFEGALECGASGRDAVVAHRALAILRLRNEEGNAALAAAELALREARALDDEHLAAEVDVEVGAIEAQTGRSEAALARTEPLRGRVELPIVTRVKVELTRCMALRQLGRGEESRAGAVAANEMLDEAGAGRALDALRREVLDALVIGAHARGEMQVAIVHASAMLEVCRRMGDEGGLGRSEMALGVLHMFGGRPVDAQRHLQRAREVAASRFDVQYERTAVLNLMKLAGDQGDADRLLQLAREGWVLSPRFARTLTRQAFLDGFFYAHQLRGELGDALAAAEQIYEGARQSGEFFAMEDAVGVTVDLYLRLGDVRTPQALLDALSAVPDAEIGFRLNLGLARARMLRGAGRNLEARRQLEALGSPERIELAQERVEWVQEYAENLLAEGDIAEAATVIHASPTPTNTELAMVDATLRLRVHVGERGRHSAPTVALAGLCSSARALLAQGRAPACHALELHKALANCLAVAGTADEAQAETALVRRRVAELAATLHSHPEHRDSFLARHADI